MIAQLRKVRFINADPASQASRSSPSISSSNKAASESSPLDIRAAISPSPQTASAYFIGDEAERPQSRAFETAREQHAQRLMREPALERIADQVILVGARKGFDQELAPARQLRTPSLNLKPLADLLGQAAPG